MYRKAYDIRLKKEPADVRKILSGMCLRDAILLQGWRVVDVYKEMPRKDLATYSQVLAYSRLEKPMMTEGERLDIWHTIKDGCEMLDIFWNGFENLPELPEDNDF